MEDILAKKNRHLFLEEKDNTQNSFISNINRAADNLELIEAFVNGFKEEDIQHLLEAFLEQINNAGNAWVLRLTEIGESILATVSGFNYAVVLTVHQDIEAGATITLPEAMTYHVGTHMLLVSWNGTVCYNGDQYEEVGTFNEKSNVIKIKQDIKAGDKLGFRTVALADTEIDRSRGIISIKDFGAVGDGVTDDTEAFENAAEACEGEIILPPGRYRANIGSDIFSRLIGEGIIDFGNGRDASPRSIGSEESVVQSYICEVTGMGNNHAIQDISICDGWLFVGQAEPGDGDDLSMSRQVRISQFKLIDNDVNYTLGQVNSNAVSPVAVAVLTGCGHGTVQAFKEGNEIYLYMQLSSDTPELQGSGYVKVKWTGSSTTETGAVRYENIPGVYYAQPNISQDGKLVLFTTNEQCFIFDKASLEASPLTVKPLHSWSFTRYISSRSGICCDGKYVYILFSRYTPSEDQAVYVYSLSGELVKTIRTDAFAAFEPEITQGIVNGKVCIGRETEGLAIYGHNLYMASKYFVATPGSVVNWKGTTFFAMSANTGSNPALSGATWYPLNAYDDSAPGWNSTTSYTGYSNVAKQFFITALSPIGDLQEDAPVYIGMFKDSSELIREQKGVLFTDNGSTARIGTLHKNAYYVPFADFLSGAFRLFSPKTKTGGTSDDFFQIGRTENGAYVYQPIDFLRSSYSDDTKVMRFGRLTDANVSIPEEDRVFMGSIGVTTAYTNLSSNEGVLITAYSDKSYEFALRLYRGLDTGDNPFQAVYAQGAYESESSTDGEVDLGRPNHRWKTVYAATGSIDTSDERKKDNIDNPSDALMRAWGRVNFKIFQFKDAIQKKGVDVARLHVGIIAQQVHEAFEAEGLDASRYGLFCYDSWEAQEEVRNADGDIVQEAREAGDAYAIRYSEALALECAYQRWLGEQRDARIEALMQRISALENNQ